MSKLKVKVRALTPKGEEAINQLVEERNLAKGMQVLRRKDLNLNQKLRFLRGAKLATGVLNQVEIVKVNDKEMDLFFNVFSGSEYVTNQELQRKGNVDEMMSKVGATKEDYEVEYL
jgi:hypothetical protein